MRLMTYLALNHTLLLFPLLQIKTITMLISVQELQFEKQCKKTVSEIVKGIVAQVNQTEDYIYRFLFYFAVNDYIDCEGKIMDVRPILSSTMKRLR